MRGESLNSGVDANFVCPTREMGATCVIGSLVEVLKAKDLGADDIARLAEFELKNEFFEALMPGKCLTKGFKALVNRGG
jgi:hypothetical protein